MMTVDYYVNGREFGYVVTSHFAKEDLTVSFSVYRNSDQIVVYYGTRSQFNVNGVPNEDVYARKKMFANDEIMPASAFIFKWLTG